MDLTTLAMVLMLAVTAVGVDTIWHPTDVILETSNAGKLENATVDDAMINGILNSEVDRIASTPSLMAKAQVQLGRQGGIGMAIAAAANMQSVALALQSRVGRQPDQIRIALFSEDATNKVLVTGSGRNRVRAFEQEVVQQKGETVIALLHRASLVGLARIDPYMTALDLMQRHASDKDFSDAETLINFAKSQFHPLRSARTGRCSKTCRASSRCSGATRTMPIPGSASQRNPAPRTPRRSSIWRSPISS